MTTLPCGPATQREARALSEYVAGGQVARAGHGTRGKTYDDHGGAVAEERLDGLDERWPLRRVQVVNLGDGVCRGLAHVGGHVTGTLLHRHDDDGDDDLDADAGHDAQRERADELVAVAQALVRLRQRAGARQRRVRTRWAELGEGTRAGPFGRC